MTFVRRLTSRTWLWGSALMLSGFVLLGSGCGSDEDTEPAATPTLQEQAAYCREVDATAAYLQDMKDALRPFDEVALVEARADVRASIDYIYSTADELEGGSDALGTLVQDLDDLNELFATTDLVAATEDIQAQADVVTADLVAMKELGDCP